MASYSYYPKHGRCLTSISGASEGDVVTLSVASNAYSLPPSRFGWQSSQFTQYTLPAPVGFDRFGHPLFDLAGLGRCPIDGSPQTEAALNAARAAERATWKVA
jgi:hypothetical protein